MCFEARGVALSLRLDFCLKDSEPLPSQIFRPNGHFAVRGVSGVVTLFAYIDPPNTAVGYTEVVWCEISKQNSYLCCFRRYLSHLKTTHLQMR